MKTKKECRHISPRLQRWLLRLGEYTFTIEYIKGKDNNVADFLSRINTDTNEINELRVSGNIIDTEDINASGSLDVETIHSQEENQNDHIPIVDTIVNKYKTQIILVETKTQDTEITNKNRKIYISRQDIENNEMDDILRRLIKKGAVGIYSNLNDHLYNLLQLKLIELFGNSKDLKFRKCTYLAKELLDDEEVIRFVKNTHEKETNHRGINENYEFLKDKIYYPKLKNFLQRYINNCSICQIAKYDRNPLKIKYKISQTPIDCNKIVHMDTWMIKGERFLTTIDKFSKHSMIFSLNDRNLITIREALKQRHSALGKPELYIGDNEFDGLVIREFLNAENVQLHLTKPNSHTGNADIEKLHSTLNEQIRIMEISPQFKELRMRDKCFKAIEFYNHSIHSVTKERPIDFITGNLKTNKQTIQRRLEEDKKNRIEKLNEDRQSEQNRNENRVLIKNYKALRHKHEPKYKYANNQNLHPVNIKRKYKFVSDIDAPSTSHNASHKS